MGYITDISEHQGSIDFGKLSKVADFVILRTQYGSNKIDKFYSQNVQGCKANNLPFGSYAYAQFVSVPDSEKEAQDFLSRIDKNTKFLVLDAEEVTVRDGKDLIPAIQRFIDICKQAGYKTGLYTGEYFLKNYGLSVIVADFIWLAKYSKNKPNSDYHLWQYTDSGNVDGISTAVDMNQLGSKPLSYFIGESNEPTSAPTSSGFIMTVRVQQDTDVRAEPSHTSGFIKNAHKDEIYNVTSHVGDWHEVVLDDNGNKGWIDGNNGQNLYWLDNPALRGQSTPQTVMHKVVSGDTVGKLAKQFGSTIDQIKNWNGLDSNYTIFVGKVIRVK